jgi:succinate dehydrogenase / fumarate reductase, cytochrome b subunit
VARTREEVSTADQRAEADDADRLVKDTGAPAPRPGRPVPLPIAFYGSAVGKKWVMAVTGVIGMGFVFAHMVGNLHVFEGPAQINHYGEWLRELLDPPFPRTFVLWAMRIGLIVAIALHLHAAYSLTRVNQKARPVKYQSKRDYVAADFAGRTMRWTGVIVLLFLIYHLMDLSFGTSNPGFVRGDVNRNLIASFEQWPVVMFYILANLALGFHLYHGAWSLFQSVGLNSPRLNPIRRPFAVAFAVIVTVGFISVPIAVLAGVIE